MNNQNYKRLVSEYPTEWLKKNIRQPSEYMSDTHIKIIKIVLKERGEL